MSYRNDNVPFTVGIQGQDESSKIAQNKALQIWSQERPVPVSVLLYNYLCVLGQIA